MLNNKPVEAYLLDKKGKALELSYKEIDSANRTDKILWVHFDYSSPEAIHWITNKSNIDSIAIDALLTEGITSRMEDIIGQIEDRADFLEENIIDSSDVKFRNEILSIRRESIILRRYLFPQKEAMNKLYHDKISIFLIN